MVEICRYTEKTSQLVLGRGFFEGWLNPPEEKIQRKILQNSYLALIAVDSDANQIVGFITAVSDGVLAACIPFLEVLPAYRRRGIGTLLVKTMLEKLHGFYMVDLCCDKKLQPFYEKQGMVTGRAMLYRNYKAQSGSV